ncbi:ubiquitin-conjugating enzyme [Mycena belliarum]|uniref:Ubiquitin-conjugating enzyme n=1 Tax=Mycena belliarum TaxID=1033014 RepID=A0AAD6TZB6_9AGAR|nr:ubiquitin-conjugating enzyme [Mycena belliae]
MSKPSTPSPASNTILLRRQLTELTKHPVEGFSAGLVDDDNLYEWEILVIGPPDTLYEGGFFKARLTFPTEFPLLPPKMRFITPMWHPNIYPDGVVCVSILHAPGDDQYGYEDAGERWMPVHTVESILISVISLLSSDTPNLDSPANLDAALEIRKDLDGNHIPKTLVRVFLIIPRVTAYRKKVRRLVRRSAEEAFD